MLLALDPAGRTGFALCEPFSSGRPRMRVGSWQLPKGEAIQGRVGVLTDNLVKLCKEEHPEYVAVEIPQSGIREGEEIVDGPMGPMKKKKVFGSILSQNQLWAYHGCVISIITAFRIPYRAVGVKEWRASVLGNGNIAGKDAKARCKTLLGQIDVHCPNEDAAEAGGIMWYLNGHFRRWQAEDDLLARQAA